MFFPVTEDLDTQPLRATQKQLYVLGFCFGHAIKQPEKAARVLWHITMSQPRLLLLGLRGLLSGGSILPKNRG